MKNIPNHVVRQVSASVQNRINILKIGQKMQDLPEELWHDSFRFYVKEDPTRKGGPNLRIIRLDPQKPSLTVTGYIFNKFVHPYENRYITPREAARLQSFPDEHEFIGSLTSVQQQVGNAVPILLARAVTEAVLEHILKYRPYGLGTVLYTDHIFPVLSLFSGAGGFDLGLELARFGNASFTTRCAIELDQDCCKTLNRNYGKRLSIFNIDIRELKIHSLTARLGLQNDLLPLIIGGPPCQAFSQAGKQNARLDPRGNLIFDFLSSMQKFKPVYFIMENVFGLHSVENGHMMQDIMERMDVLGYNVNYKVLCAADYGVAQLRRRLFFIGVQKPFPPVIMPLPSHGIGSGLDLFAIKPYFTVGEAFAGLPTI